MPSFTDVAAEIVAYPLEHLRVLGLAGSGKTRLVIERYKALVQAHGPGAAFVITYSRDQLRRITASLIDDGSGLDGLSPVLTHFTLAREILTAAGRQPPRVIDDLEERLLVTKIIDDNARQLKSDYKKIRESRSFQEELLDVFHLFLQNGIGEERLDLLKSKAARDQRLRDIISLYEKYRDALAAARRVTYYDISRAAVAVCGELPRDHALRRARVLLVDDFQDIDAGQFELLMALAPPGGDLALNVFGDPMGAYFGFRGTHVRFLNDVFPEMYRCKTLSIRGDDVGDARLDAALAALAGEVLGSEAESLHRPRVSGGGDWGPLFEGASAGATRTVRMEIARDEVEEMYGAAARVRDLIDEEGYPPNEIAVVTNEKSRYEPMLRAAFAQHGVPVNTGRPGQDAFRSFVHTLFVLIDSPRDVVEQQALITSPFYPYFRSEGLGILAEKSRDSAREVTRLERALRSATAGLPKGRGRLPHMVTFWLRPACEPYREETGDESVYGFLSLLARRWEEYVAAVEPLGRPPSIGDFMRVSDLFGTAPAAPMPSADEVGFYSCREARGKFFRCVIVLGCSELLFPSALRRESVMPATALQALLDRALPELHVRVHAARSPLDHLHAEYHLLYHTLVRSREALYLSAPKKLSGQEFPAPAAILAEVFDAPARGEISTREITPAQTRFARAWVREAPSPALADRLSELSPFGRLWNLGAVEPSRFAIPRFRISKSSLETYSKCARKFFYEKALRIRDEETSAQLVGSLFHKVMAEISKRFPDKKTLHESITDAMIADTVEQAIMGEWIDAGAFVQASLRFHINVMVGAALKLDAKDPSDYTVSRIEDLFRFDHLGWEFSGKFDRIENTAEGAVVLDYKTGEFKKTAENLRERTLKVLEEPEKANWQVPLYVWGYKAEFGDPDAFRHLVQQPGEEPFFVTLYIRRDEKDLPPAALSRKREHNKFSYLLIGEIEAIMKRATATAEEMFSERTGFEKTPEPERCRNCSFVGVCDRRLD